tara:strand:+ start:1620 stop:3656 length:2037 start_codon:yes stop_codon:yes gene_type:complete
MADTYQSYSNAGQTTFSVPFPYLNKQHVKVFKGRDIVADTQTSTLSDGTDYNWASSGTQITLTSALGSGEVLTVERQTPSSSQLSPWSDGSNLTAEELNNADLQNLYIVQEQKDRNSLAAAKSIAAETASTNAVNASTTAVNTANAALPKAGGTMSGPIAMGTSKITGLGDPTAAQDAATKNYIDTKVFGSTQIDTNAITNSELAPNSVQSANIVNGTILAEDLATGTLDGRYYTETELDAGQLDNRYYTEIESDARYFNISSGETIKDGDTFPDNDTTIATTAAINDRIVDLVEEVGGFVPIANETSFPAANPDVNNGTGTLVSVKVFASSHTPSGGTVTIVNGAGAGNNVTITGCGTTVLSAGFGAILETTSTLHTYTFHRLTPKATEVTTVAGISANVTTVANNNSNITTVATNNANITTVATNIANVNTVGGAIANVNTVATNITNVNNFNDLYQISTSAPTADGGGNALAAGDMWFDSSSNKTLKVHNGTTFQSVSPSQSVLNDISIVSGSLTRFEDLGSIVDAVTTGSGTGALNVCATNITNVNTVGGAIANVNTVASNISNINAVGTSSANVNAVASNISSVNSFAETYRIASSAPTTSLNAGDLWFDATANVLKYYNGTNWTVTAAAGLSNVSEDTSPELGGHLDCNDKNLTEVGTISGNNLQVDFGTLS